MAMEIAQAPAKTLMMQGFMMYMSGSSVSIITIMIVGMSLLNSVKALAAVNQRECALRAWQGQREKRAMASLKSASHPPPPPQPN